MKKLMDAYQFRSWLSFLLLAAAILAMYIFAIQIDIVWGWAAFFLSAVSPFVWGFVIAYVLNMPRVSIERLLDRLLYGTKGANIAPYLRARKHGISILLTYVSVLFIVAIVMNIVVPRVYQSILEFVEFLPVLFAAIERLIFDLDQNDAIPFFDIGLLLSLVSWEEILAVFNPDNITMVFETLMDFSSAVFSAALAFISSIYFMTEGGKLKAFAVRLFRALLSSSICGGVFYYGSKVNGYFKRYIFCQVLDALILGVIMTVVTSLLGVRHAFVIGPMLGFANLIPYFGSIIGTIVAIVIVLFTEDFAFGVLIAIVLLVIQQIDSNIIFPRLLGSSMKISPLLVIIAIAVGNAYYGVVGMIIAIPISTVLKNILDDILEALEGRKNLSSPPE